MCARENRRYIKKTHDDVLFQAKNISNDCHWASATASWGVAGLRYTLEIRKTAYVWCYKHTQRKLWYTFSSFSSQVSVNGNPFKLKAGLPVPTGHAVFEARHE